MSAPKRVCGGCLEPLGDCLCPDEVSECDAAQFGAPPTLLPDGSCRCTVCARCGHHTGNSGQGHYWAWCKVLADRARAQLAAGETLSMAELMNRGEREFHFCCPGNCELEEDLPGGSESQGRERS